MGRSGRDALWSAVATRLALLDAASRRIQEDQVRGERAAERGRLALDQRTMENWEFRYFILLYYIILCYITLNYIMLYCIILYCIILYILYFILYFFVLFLCLFIHIRLYQFLG